MTGPRMHPRDPRNPLATAGVIAVAAIVVLLLAVFAVSRLTRPPEEAGPVVASAPGVPVPGRLGAPGGSPSPATAALPAPSSATPQAGGAASPPLAATPPDPSLTGATRADDVILARQLLMDGNEAAMMPIDLAAGGKDIPLPELKAEAYAIYTFLSAAPHLFPAETRPVPSPDGSPPATAATEAIWADFDAFYDAATAAAGVAFDASQAADMAKFRDLAGQLRTACDSCHAQFMHVFDPATGK